MKKFPPGGAAFLFAAAMSISTPAQPTASNPAPSNSAALAGIQNNVPASAREQAYLKLLEGQRHLWKSNRYQTQAGRANAMRLARAAFLGAVELDPALAEGYTALAELAVALPPVDIDEAVRLASQAVKIDRNNFGGHRMLARLYTIKSRLNGGSVDKEMANLAVVEWEEVTRLDPRNAEGWAFLSEFAESGKDLAAQAAALRKWVSAAPPLDVQFYGRVMGGAANLTPETASLKLASVLARTGKRHEATSILSALVADDSDNTEAIALLGDMVDSAEGETAVAAVTALQQAIYANPENVSLIDMLARLLNRVGRFDDAVTLLKLHIVRLTKSEPQSASTLMVSLGQMYLSRDRYSEAVNSFEASLSVRGIGAAATAVKPEDREFAHYVLEKLIHVNKLAGTPAAARSVIDRAKKVLGKDDTFADRHLVMLFQAQGAQKEALDLIRTLRISRPDDLGLRRTEASILTMLGQVDSAVELVRGGGRRQPASPTTANGESNATVIIAVPPTDEFSDLLFISNLYSRAKRNKEAIDAANQALSIAAGSERRQIARVTLATGLHMSGNAAAAEQILREVLKETPDNPMALNNLGYFLIERGAETDHAVKMIEQALKIDPNNPSYLDSLGWAYFKSGKYAEAERYLLDAIRLDADSPTIHEHLGDVYQARQEPGKAKTAWERALRLSSDPETTGRLKAKLAK